MLHRRDWLNLSRLTGGAFAASAISLLFLPVVARMFGPAVIGVVQSYLALLAIVVGLVTLRYELAIMVAAPAERSRVTGATLWVVAACSAIVFLVCFALAMAPGPWRDGLGWQPELFLVLGIATFVGGVALVQQHALMASGAFGAVAGARMAQALVVGAGTVLLGLLHVGWESLVLAALAGSLLQLAFGGRAVLREAIAAVPDRATLRGTLLQYRDFPAINLPSNLLNTTAGLLPTVLIAARFGPENAAYFALGNRLFDVVLQPVASGLGSVYLKGVAEDLQAGIRPTRRFLYVVSLSTAVSGAVALVLMVTDRVLVSLLLGDAFLPIVTLLPWLAAWRVMQFINHPVSVTYTALRRQRVGFVLVLLFFVPRLACFLVGDDFLFAVQAYSMVSLLFYLVYCIVAVRLVMGGTRV